MAISIQITSIELLILEQAEQAARHPKIWKDIKSNDFLTALTILLNLEEDGRMCGEASVVYLDINGTSIFPNTDKSPSEKR